MPDGPRSTAGDGLPARGPRPVAGGAFATSGPDPALVADCVHCGFCLPSCPTYLLDREEMDSPRGRIYLMREGIVGAPLSTPMRGHFDACLGCMACMTACPSGVRYDRLIEATRAEIEAQVHRPLRERLLRGAIFALFPYPRRLRPVALSLRPGWRRSLLGLIARAARTLHLPVGLQTMLEIAPTVPAREPLAEFSSALGVRRGAVALLRGCVQGAFFPDVNLATARVLAAEGFEVLAPKDVGCCGALSGHSGRHQEAVAFARSVIEVLGPLEVDAIIVNAAGCGSAMKDYGELLADDPLWAGRARAFSARVRDVAEFLDSVEPVAPRHPLPLRVAYHDACHLAHAQGVRGAPRRLLDAIPGLERAELAEAEICCGSAGVYNLLQPTSARRLGSRKARNLIDLAPDLLVSANPGCTMQIGAALAREASAIPARHTIELLDASLRGLDPAEVLRAFPSRS